MQQLVQSGWAKTADLTSEEIDSLAPEDKAQLKNTRDASGHGYYYDYGTALGPICILAGQLLPQVGLSALQQFYTDLLDNLTAAEVDAQDLLFALYNVCHDVYRTSRFTGFEGAGAATPGPLQPEQDQLVCWLAQTLLQRGEKGDRARGTGILECAAQHRASARAATLLKSGTGAIAPAHTHYKGKAVQCAANDVSKTVSIKIGQEGPEAYEEALGFLIRLLGQGFPKSYAVQCNSKVKTTLPVKGLKKTKTHSFFANAAAWPALYPQLEAYLAAAFTPDEYYSDAEDENAVHCGGYALYALAFANPDGHFSLVENYLRRSDFDHAITAQRFVEAYSKVCGKAGAEKLKAYQDAFIY